MNLQSTALNCALALSLVSACDDDSEPTSTSASGGVTSNASSPATGETTGGTTGEATSEPTGGATSEIPVELRGVWLDSWSISLEYELATELYDFDTNVWFKGYDAPWDLAPYRGYGISFDQDGNFIWVLGSDGGLGGCQSYSIDFMKGTAQVVDADTIRFHAAARRQRYDSTCDPSLNYDVDASGGEFEMNFVIGATVDTGLPTLRIINKSDGTSFDYFHDEK